MSAATGYRALKLIELDSKERGGAAYTLVVQLTSGAVHEGAVLGNKSDQVLKLSAQHGEVDYLLIPFDQIVAMGPRWS